VKSMADLGMDSKLEDKTRTMCTKRIVVTRV